MTVLDVCSGIGGFSLAAAWCGWQTIGFCEIDLYCRRVLAKHWPGVPQHDNLWTLTADIVSGWLAGAAALHDTDRSRCERPELHAQTVEWPGVGWTNRADAGLVRGWLREANALDADGDAELHGAVNGQTRPRQLGQQLDLLCGGIPCQPFSVAGKQRGQDDPRHLWPAVAGLVADLRPAWLVLENVAGFIRLALDDVLADLDRLGYAAWPLVAPAAGVGALHRRDRVWIIATDANRRGCESVGIGGVGRALGERRDAGLAPCGGETGECDTGQVEPGFRAASDGLSGRLARFVDPAWNGDPMQAFGCNLEYTVPLVTAERVPDRVNKLKALGNSIVPQVAYQIFQAIDAAERGA